MRRLHFFYPENDLALALDIENYTPPPAASRLRRSGEVLGLWYGEPGDMVLDHGVNARWYENIRSRFGLQTSIYEGNPDGLIPAPWGWSKASRLQFRRLGFADDTLPGNAQLERMRELSHRRTAAAIGAALRRELPFAVAPPAMELHTFDEICSFVNANGSSVLKLPWSSSGRGLLFATPADVDRIRPQLDGVLRRQGSIMGERRYLRILDFAMLFTMEGGCCNYNGLSLFRTDDNGGYSGNILASQAELHSAIEHYTPRLDIIADALCPIIEDIIGSDYQGPIGIDMMAVDGCDVRVVPVVELNLRMTMGHLCRIFYEKHIVHGASGNFKVLTGDSGIDATTLHGTRISFGSISLSPPTSPFSFQITIN